MRCAAAKEVRGGDYGVGNGLCARADRVGKIGVDSVRLQTRGGCGFHDCARKGFFQQDSRAFDGDSVPVFKDAQPQPQVLGSETVSQQLSQYFRMIAISLSRYQERVDAAGLFEIDLESLERDKDRENARLPRLERKLRQPVRRQDLAANQADGPPDIVALTVEQPVGRALEALAQRVKHSRRGAGPNQRNQQVVIGPEQRAKIADHKHVHSHDADAERTVHNGAAEESVLFPEELTRTRRKLEAERIAVRTVPAEELAKAEGGVTCCSLIVVKQG